MNKLYHDLLASFAHSAVAKAKAASELHHDGERGYLRERLMADLFRPLLPTTLAVGTGVVVNAEDQQSTQCDIIVYDRSLVPAVIVAEGHGIFPVESVIYVIEVKSKLNATELKSAHDAATSLREQARKHSSNPRLPMSVVFAFGSDIASSESERYDKYRGPEQVPALRAICIAGKEYGYWSTALVQTGSWRKWPGPDPVVGFLGQLMNQLPSSVGNDVKMGRYLTDQ